MRARGRGLRPGFILLDECPADDVSVHLGLPGPKPLLGLLNGSARTRGFVSSSRTRCRCSLSAAPRGSVDSTVFVARRMVFLFPRSPRAARLAGTRSTRASLCRG